ncbi:NosL [compost metagenome]
MPILPEADECARCRMAVEQPRFAGELIAHDGQALKFDDIGCMAEYVKAQGARLKTPRAMFVGDFSSGKWLRLEKATIVRTTFPTPMRYGLLAFESPQAAKKLDAKYKAKPVSWAELVKGR